MTVDGLRGVEPYLYYEDGTAALDWLTRVLGFREVVRYLDENGAVAEAELLAGSTRVHVAGGATAYWEKSGVQAPVGLELIVVAPQDKPYAARTYAVRDPQGYSWTFWQPLPADVELQPGWHEVRP